MRLLVALVLLLGGCADGWIVGHFQTSDEWHQPGAWDALPDGQIGRYTTTTIFFGGGLHDQAFRAPDLDDAWGADRYRLQFVRWDDHGPDGSFRTVQFEPDYLQVWLGIELGSQDARETFLEVAPAILGDEDLEAMADRLEQTERTFTANGEQPARKVYGFAIDRPDFEGAYAGLGTLPDFDSDTHIGATGFLPVPGQVTLRHGNWEFHLDTAMKRVHAGGDADADLLWVSPTDELQFVHRDRYDLSDAEATAHLKAALEALGLPVPPRSWTFEHEPIEESFGD